MSAESISVTLALIGLLAILCQWFAWWVKLPAILFLLLTGIVAGPVTGWLDPSALFGDLLFPLVSLGVAVILFEGSLTLKFHDIAGLEKVVRRFVSTGVLVTWAVITLSSYYLLQFSWSLSLLFGAVMVVTGPTVIVPMLRTVRPNARIANILKWEGIVIDPVGALLAVLVFEFIISDHGNAALGHTLLTFIKVILIGLVLGVLAGWLFGLLLRRHLLPEYLHNVAALCVVCAVFVLSNVLQEESGLLTVTVMGMWLANMKGVDTEDILDFKETLSVLFISVLFILLAARVEFSDFHELGWAALGVFAMIQFVARPAKVALATWGSPLSWQERLLLGWIAPRGIVAAAVIALFALRLEEQGVEQAKLLVPLAFTVIIGTVVLQSASAGLLARWLGVAEPEPRGLLIIGASPLARAIAGALKGNDFRVLLTDSYWDNVRQARMEGLTTFYGNPVSEHADRHLDLVGIGRMLALSPQRELNTLACLRYRTEFGRQGVYQLTVTLDEKEQPKKAPAHGFAGQTAFGGDVSYSKLASMLSRGAEMHSTGLKDDFSWEDYQGHYRERAVPMFFVDNRGRLRVRTDQALEPQSGWKVIAMVLPEDAAAGAGPGHKSI